MADIDWADVRGRIMLDASAVNLNSGSGGPLPRSVFDRLGELRHRLAEAPMDFLLHEVPPLLSRARLQLADMVGAEPSRLAFTSNVTEAVNMVATGLALQSSGEILLTDHEYLPMRWCWERAAQRLKLELRTVRLPLLPADPEELVAAVVAAMTPRTLLFHFSHVLATTGLVLPAERLCDEARKRGIRTLVDGAHAPGSLDLDLAGLDCDFYAGSGHKWLLGPVGNGFLYLGRESADLLEPLQVSWAYYPPNDATDLDEPDRFGSTARLRRFECAGTRDICPWLALPRAIDFRAAVGGGQIRSRMRELADYARKRLADLPGLSLASPADPRLSGPMTAFRLPEGRDPTSLSRRLWQRCRIEVAAVSRPELALLRVSTHFYNTEAEIEYLAEALGEALVAG